MHVAENSSKSMATIATIAATARRLRWHLLVFGAFALLVCLLNFPLVLHLDTHVVGRSFEDVFEVLWQLSWMDAAVFEKGIYPFYTPDVFYPQGWYVASGAQPAWYLLLLSPVTHLFGPTATYNIVQLSTFVFAAFGVYLLVSELTTYRLAAFIAGAAYIAAPTLTLRQGGHLHLLIGAQFLPYTVFYSYRALTSEKRRRMWILLAAGTLALSILGHWYFLFIATLPLIGLFAFIPSTGSFRSKLRTGLLTTVIALILITPFAYLSWDARDHMFAGEGEFSVDGIDMFGLSPDYLMAGNPNHPLWGEASRHHFPIHGEQDFVAIGYATLVLALIGVAGKPWRQTRAFVATAAIALLLAMGLTLHWHARRLLLPVSPSVEQIYYAIIPFGPTLPSGHIAIPLPALFLYRFVPLMASMRVWARFTIPLMLSVAVLAGLGASCLLQSGRWARMGAVGLGLLVIFEGVIIPYENFTPVAVNHRAVDEWLAEQRAGTTLIEYPIPAVNKLALYSQSLHGQRIVNGYMSTEPLFLQQARERLGTWPNGEAISLLRKWDVHYIVLSGRSTSAEFQQRILPEVRALPGVCLVKEFDDGFMDFDRSYVFEISSATGNCN